ncbi:hypothetical protein BDV12DRAFT_210554 [Aspergillus spectabilis]
MSPLTVVVIGATGAQGGSVVRELLQQPGVYHVRALAELAIAEAAAQTITLQQFIWNTLSGPVKLSEGRYLNVHHWKSKSLVTEYIEQEHPALWAKTIAIIFPNHFENCINFPRTYLPTKNEAGTYTHSFLHSPEMLMPNVSITDTGKLVRAVIEAGSTYFTKTITFYSQALSETEKLGAFGERYQVKTRYNKISASEFQKFMETRYDMTSDIALDFTEQLMIVEDFGKDVGNVYAREEFVQATDIPGLSLQTWSDFLDKHDLLAIATRESSCYIQGRHRWKI